MTRHSLLNGNLKRLQEQPQALKIVHSERLQITQVTQITQPVDAFAQGRRCKHLIERALARCHIEPSLRQLLCESMQRIFSGYCWILGALWPLVSTIHGPSLAHQPARKTREHDADAGGAVTFAPEMR